MAEFEINDIVHINSVADDMGSVTAVKSRSDCLSVYGKYKDLVGEIKKLVNPLGKNVYKVEWKYIMTGSDVPEDLKRFSLIPEQCLKKYDLVLPSDKYSSLETFPETELWGGGGKRRKKSKKKKKSKQKKGKSKRKRSKTRRRR